jgi:hypothetical protein
MRFAMLLISVVSVVSTSGATRLWAQPSGATIPLTGKGDLCAEIGYYSSSTDWESRSACVGFSKFRQNIVYLRCVYGVVNCCEVFAGIGLADLDVADMTSDLYNFRGDKRADYGFEPSGSAGIRAMFTSREFALGLAVQASVFSEYATEKHGLFVDDWGGTMPVNIVVSYDEMWNASVAAVLVSRVRFGEIYTGFVGYRSGARSEQRIRTDGIDEVEAGYGEGSQHAGLFLGCRLRLWGRWSIDIEGRALERGFGVSLGRSFVIK